jgi:pathogenesis-related protein 1
MQRKNGNQLLLVGGLTAAIVIGLGISGLDGNRVGFSAEPALAQSTTAQPTYKVGQTIVVRVAGRYYLSTINRVRQQNGATAIDYSWRQGNRRGSGSTVPAFFKDSVFTVEEAARRGLTLANAPSPTPASSTPATPSPQVSPIGSATPPQSSGANRCPGLQTGLTNAEIDEILRVHNAARAAVKVPPLTWNCKLAEFSQAWANRDVWGHSSGADRRNVISGSYVGENLAAAAPATQPIATSGPTDWWDEKQFWNNSAKACEPGKVCGHYTQMVWRATTEIGCGLNRKSSALGSQWQGNSAYLACTYNPGGNYNGEAPY